MVTEEKDERAENAGYVAASRYYDGLTSTDPNPAEVLAWLSMATHGTNGSAAGFVAGWRQFCEDESIE